MIMFSFNLHLKKLNIEQNNELASRANFWYDMDLFVANNHNQPQSAAYARAYYILEITPMHYDQKHIVGKTVGYRERPSHK